MNTSWKILISADLSLDISPGLDPDQEISLIFSNPHLLNISPSAIENSYERIKLISALEIHMAVESIYIFSSDLFSLYFVAITTNRGVGYEQSHIATCVV